MKGNSPSEEVGQSDVTDGDIQKLMEDYELDRETAEKVWEIMEEQGLDEEEAIELADYF